jgi:hypothetical protein
MVNQTYLHPTWEFQCVGRFDFINNFYDLDWTKTLIVTWQRGCRDILADSHARRSASLNDRDCVALVS